LMVYKILACKACSNAKKVVILKLDQPPIKWQSTQPDKYMNLWKIYKYFPFYLVLHVPFFWMRWYLFLELISLNAYLPTPTPKGFSQKQMRFHIYEEQVWATTNLRAVR
jgi:hypothetical protein